MPEPTDLVYAQVDQIIVMQTELAEATNVMMTDPKFRALRDQQDLINTKMAELWKNVETVMIDNDIKSVKGDWGSLTIVERTDFDIDYAELPAKFFKKVVDTTKISGTYKLEGKAPKGATPKIHRHIMKKLKPMGGDV